MELVITTQPLEGVVNEHTLLQVIEETRPNSTTKCPVCGPTRKKKNVKSAKVFANEKGKGIHCEHCKLSAAAFPDDSSKTPKRKKEVSVPYVEPKLVAPSDPIEKYFYDRGISKSTMDWVGVSAKNEGVIAFPRFENGRIVGTKYRNLKSGKERKMWQDKSSANIFHNLDAIHIVGEPLEDYLIITEGEIDEMSWIEAGYLSVVSLPVGLNKGEDQGDKLACLKHAGPILAKFKRFILATDGDEVGRQGMLAIGKHLGREKCEIVEYPKGCKDSNDVLVKGGVAAIKAMYDNLKPFPVDEILRVNDESLLLDEVFRNGLPEIPGLGFSKKFDSILKVVDGQLTVTTGIPNHGKTGFIVFLLCCLAVQRGKKFAIFSPEQRAPKQLGGQRLPTSALIFNQLATILIGKSWLRTSPQKSQFDMTEEEHEMVKKFINKHFIFINTKQGEGTLDNILDLTDFLYLKDNIDGVLIDPWNRIEDTPKNNEMEHQMIRRMLRRLNYFKEDRGLSIFIIAHPTKVHGVRTFMLGDVKHQLEPVPTLYNISGSATFRDSIDNGIVVYRNFATGQTEIYIEKVKFALFGKVGMVDLEWNHYRYHEGLNADKSNWLIGATDRPEEPVYQTKDVNAPGYIPF